MTSADPTAISGGSKPFQSAVRLQTSRPPARFPSANQDDASEARYWAEKFGLGSTTAPLSNSHTKNAKFAHPRALQLQAGTASVVHQIVLGATAASTDYRNSKHNLLAVACGPRVPLYGTTPQSAYQRALHQHSQRFDATRTVDPDRQVPTGGQLATAVALRVDGRLLAIGTAQGAIRVADTTSRATLFTTSSASNNNNNSSSHLPVRAVAWFRDGRHILSAGDDGVLRVWALKGGGGSGSNNAPVLQLRGHGDAIRCADLWQKAAATGQSSQTLAATGSYDHTVRLWDLQDLDDEDNKNNNSSNEQRQQQQRCRFVLQHEAPVEALQWMKSTDPDVPIWLISAGGTTVKVWNPVTGRCAHTLSAQHRKSISSLVTVPRRDPENNNVRLRLVTGGLDGLLRIHSLDTATGRLRYLHGVQLPGSTAVTALAATFTGDRIAIGTTSGTVLVRQVGAGGSSSSTRSRKRTAVPTAGTFAFFTRGMNADPVAGDHIVVDDSNNNNNNNSGSNKKRKVAKFDLALKQFRYGDALDEALETRMPQAVVAVLEELGKRRGLTIALSNRDEESLEPVLAFTARYIARPRFAALLIGVADKLIDIYGDVAGQSETIDELFVKLRNHVSEELRTQKLLFRVVGQLDSVLTEAERLER